MSADILRRAAAKLREHATAATPGPWEHVGWIVGAPEPTTFSGCGQVITWAEGVEAGDICAPSGDLYPRSGYSPREDMAYVALMHPPVALAVADVLEAAAAAPFGTLWPTGVIAVARAILREPAPAEVRRTPMIGRPGGAA